MRKDLTVTSSRTHESVLEVPGHLVRWPIHQIPLNSRVIGWNETKIIEDEATANWQGEGCGLKHCDESQIAIDTEPVELGVSRRICSAVLTCASVTCPYGDGPGENDNEVLAPAPQPPSLEATTPLPTETQ